MGSMTRGERATLWGLVSLLAGSGVLHLVAPGGYRQIVPKAIGHAPEMVAISGVAELICAGAMAFPATRRVGGLASAVLFVVVFPANVQMALDGGLPGAGFPLGNPVVAWLRLPLQIPLVLGALAVARRAARLRG